MKKILSAFLAAVMLFCAAACSENGGPADTTGTPSVTTAELTEEMTQTEELTEAEETAEETTASPFSEPSEEVLSAPAATEFTVSRVFSDNMVIQRNEVIRVWGFAPAEQNGRRVNAEFAGLTGAALIEDGEFMITLNGSLPECTEPRQFKVEGDGVEYVFNDVLVGDVFWVVGQSNIHYELITSMNEPLTNPKGRFVKISDDDLIRLHRSTTTDPSGLTAGTADVNKDTPIKRGWEKPKAGAGMFSALGYFAARMLYDKLEKKIPIGMIEFGAAGAALNAFCPNEVCDELKIDKWRANLGYYMTPSVNNHPTRFVYNHYMYSFRKYPICGLIWYQGESDCNSPNDKKYPERFAALIKNYRDTHDLINHDYPVYVVEFPAIWYPFPFASVRTYMGTLPNYVENLHISQSSDLWKDSKYENNLHPYVKWEQAERLTSIILADKYGVGDPYSEGPSAVSAEFSEDGMTVTLKFRNAGEGLRFEGGEPKGFKVVYKSTQVDPESVEITGPDTVVVKGSQKIKSVRYNCDLPDTFPETLTLCNSSGVPCAAFIFNIK